MLKVFPFRLGGLPGEGREAELTLKALGRKGAGEGEFSVASGFALEEVRSGLVTLENSDELASAVAAAAGEEAAGKNISA